MAFSTDTIPKSYAPSEVEAGIRSKWDEARVGHCESDADGEPFCIIIPPPNVTAPLHLGHALNNTLQDILIRWNRMKGAATLWMPGLDHAGIATQTVVEKRLLQQEGKKRTDFKREEFVQKVQAWKDEYEVTILDQLRGIGASCDWERKRFTMDEVCVASVREAFFRLFNDELIYRGKRLVNWDPVTLTALADDEVEMKEVQGHMYYLRYPLEEEDGFVTVATTRPETMLGDTAVAIHPNDPRAASFRGKHIRLPIVNRLIPIVEDEYVVMSGEGDDPKAAFATGFLKVTPAHDPNDWEIGIRHDLEVINVMSPSASISDKHGWEDVSDEAKQFVGLSREHAREAIIDWFKSHKLFDSIKEYTHSVGHSYRSHVPIEPYLSDQWYVKVTDDRLCNEALRALHTDQYDGSAPLRESGERIGDGQVRFYPKRYSHTFQAWHENLRDWCISRQLWWGHQIPVWSKTFSMNEEANFPHANHAAVAFHIDKDEADEGTRVYVCIAGGHEEIEKEFEQVGFIRDKDVLDTWFSSALWPISTMGWPDPHAFPETTGLLDRFNPSSVLCTGRDIITLWVSRMVMFNRYFRGGILPFTDVYIHPMIQDGFGQRMSKSLGNGVDPRDIIATHGADAMRYSMAQLATGTQDVRLSVDLICPHTNTVFKPEYVQSHTGHQVMAPVQLSPDGSGRKMSTLYGLLIGEVQDDAETPQAMNSSTRFDVGRNFANKFWNASRFALMNITNPAARVHADEMHNADQWMLQKVIDAKGRVDKALTQYQFSAAVEAIYDLLWRDFCDWYLEAIKPTVKENYAQQRVLLSIVDTICRLLHPICPFVTEAIWPHIQSLPSGSIDGVELPESEMVVHASWPNVSALQLDTDAVESFEQIRELVVTIRAARAQQKVKPKRKITLLAPSPIFELASSNALVLSSLASLGNIARMDSSSEGLAIPFGSSSILIADMFDGDQVQANKENLIAEIATLKKQIEGFKAKLANEAYINNAPEKIVQETKNMLAKAESDLVVAQEAIIQ